MRFQTFCFRLVFGTVNGGGDKERKKDQYQLGFSDEADPLKDFSSPPARLALECLTYYADNHERQFARMAIENSSKDSGKQSTYNSKN